MTIQDMTILIECKRLVETMLHEKRAMLKSMERCGKDPYWVQNHIIRLERALEGKPPIKGLQQDWRGLSNGE